LAALVLSVAGCSALGDGNRTPVSAQRVAPSTKVPGRSSTSWLFAPSLVGSEWEKVPTSTNLAALTFDAGSGDQGLSSILATLEEKNVTATFFLTGKWAEQFSAQANEIADRYPIGNHTYSHPEHLLDFSDAAVAAEVEGGADAIRSQTHVDPRPLFRFPYGARDARTIGLVNRLGYGAVRWTVDTLGWKGLTGGQSVDTVQSRILAELQPGEIVLMHVGAANDGTTLDADALPAVIDAIRARGYRFTDLYRFSARYANIADDGSGRFAASVAWKTSTSSRERYGASSHYVSPRPLDDPAHFKLRAPQTARYRLYAWWPVSSSYNPAATISLTLRNGSLRSFLVDQRAHGGRWVLLGKVWLRAGDDWRVNLVRRSPRTGSVVADAFRLSSLMSG